MPQLSDLRRQYPTAAEYGDREALFDESLVSDVRSQLSSTDVVERKVGAALGVCYWILGGMRGPGRSSPLPTRYQPGHRILPR